MAPNNALAELKRMREEANEATETWRARLERESGAREKVEGELREDRKSVV